MASSLFLLERSKSRSCDDSSFSKEKPSLFSKRNGSRNDLVRLLRFDSEQGIGQLIGAGSVASLRTRAFNALEFANHLIERLADYQLIDALGIARTTADCLNLEDGFAIIGDDHLA